MTQLEGEFLLWIQEQIRNDVLTPVLTFITHLGDAGIFWIILTLLLLILPKTRKAGIVCAFALFASFIINNLILKNVIARVRPYEAIEGLNRIIEKQADFSFPSGHAASSFSVAVSIFLCFKKNIGIPALILAFLIALSRLYVGVHFPTDVLCGALSGTLLAILFYWIFNQYVFKNKGGIYKNGGRIRK